MESLCNSECIVLTKDSKINLEFWLHLIMYSFKINNTFHLKIKKNYANEILENVKTLEHQKQLLKIYNNIHKTFTIGKQSWIKLIPELVFKIQTIIL